MSISSIIRDFFDIGAELDTFDVSKLEDSDRNNIEADSFWCLSKLLDGIQDNYTFAQPGIQNKVRQLKELVERVDGNFKKKGQLF